MEAVHVKKQPVPATLYLVNGAVDAGKPFSWLTNRFIAAGLRQSANC